MRIIDSIPHPQLTISIFSMNEKFLVKFEVGPYEQTYKVSQGDVGSLADLKAKITESFCDEVIAIFRKMHVLGSQLGE
ncbi:MAG: hypothetical protein K1X77_06670 [Bacteroidia bacterium]|nr:hypothetical protein [Bacteroidia bacterium]